MGAPRSGSDQPVEMTRKCGEESACFPAGARLQRVCLSPIYGVLQQIVPRIGCIQAEHDIQQQYAIFWKMVSRQLRGSMHRWRSVNIGPLSSSPVRSIPPVNDDRYAQYAGAPLRPDGTDPEARVVRRVIDLGYGGRATSDQEGQRVVLAAPQAGCRFSVPRLVVPGLRFFVGRLAPLPGHTLRQGVKTVPGDEAALFIGDLDV
jgi:hypothetical protein